MAEVTLRPGRDIQILKIAIVIGDLMFLSLPWLTRSFSFGAVFGVLVVLVSLVCAAAITFFGWLGLNMRVEVAPDAVRSYYFRPMPWIFPRELITDVRIAPMPRSGNYVPCLILVGGAARMVPQLTKRTAALAEIEAEKLRAALREVAPAGS